MDSRCYSPRPNQIRLQRLSISRQDTAVLAGMILVLGLGLMLILFDKGVI
jgi:energy-coupling factor transporter transmembrane protein EcfT